MEGIDPHIACVSLKDDRLSTLAHLQEAFVVVVRYGGQLTNVDDPTFSVFLLLLLCLTPLWAAVPHELRPLLVAQDVPDLVKRFFSLFHVILLIFIVSLANHGFLALELWHVPSENSLFFV